MSDTFPPAVAADGAATPERQPVTPATTTDAAGRGGNRFDRLIADYDAFLASNPALPNVSAEELLHEDLTDAQRRWVSGFLIEWEDAEISEPERPSLTLDNMSRELPEEPEL